MGIITDKLPSSSALRAISTNINQAVKSATNPVYSAQQEGRRMSGYSSGSTGGGLVHDYSNYNSGNNTTKAGGNSGGRSSGNSGSGSVNVENTGYSEPAFDWGAYYAELQRQAQERANAAYERNMARIADAYGSAAGSLRGNYDSTVDRLNAARDKSMTDVNNDAEKSLREAYINNMLSKKNLNQRLSAMGYNGGATESTMAQLANNYGNSRTGINETLNKNINDLNMTYGDNLAAALQSYNSAIANLDLQRMQLEMEAENARNNAMDSSMSVGFGMDNSYLAALQSALANQSAYQYDPTMATNDFIAGNAQQAQSAAEGHNFAKYLAQAQLQASQGVNVNTITNDLFNAVSKGELDINSLYSILKQLGAA